MEEGGGFAAACREIAVHETADQSVIVVEYELSGTLRGEPAAAAFIAVLEVRDGKIVLWREYEDALAITAALGQ